MPYKVAVYGAGGVGAYLAGRLAEAGAEVYVVARGENLKAIRDEGIKVTSIGGNCHVKIAGASDDPASIGQVDAVIVACKTYNLKECAEEMGPLLGSETLVIPTLNGLEAPSILQGILGGGHAVGGYISIVSVLESPGHVQHTGCNPALFGVGALKDSPPWVHQQLERFDAVCKSAKGLKVAVDEDVLAGMWRKLVGISVLSSVTAICRCGAGVFTKYSETMATLKAALTEGAHVARAHGCTMPAEAIVQRTIMGFSSLSTQDPTSLTSLARDMLAGKPTELDSQLGVLLAKGREVGVATPVLSTLYALQLPLINAQEPCEKQRAAALGAGHGSAERLLQKDLLGEGIASVGLGDEGSGQTQACVDGVVEHRLAQLNMDRLRDG